MTGDISLYITQSNKEVAINKTNILVTRRVKKVLAKKPNRIDDRHFSLSNNAIAAMMTYDENYSHITKLAQILRCHNL